jgi:hypothetical protein
VYDQKEFTFEYPIQNTKLLKGTEQTIYWQSDGIETIKLEYSTDNTNWFVLRHCRFVCRRTNITSSWIHRLLPGLWILSANLEQVFVLFLYRR